jgi:fructose-bisphosphate aldolase class II
VLVTTEELFAAAAKRHATVAAFNVITMEHAEAITAGADRAGHAVILQISENAVRFHGGRPGPIAAAARAIAESSVTPTALHLDHVTSVELLHAAPECGFSSAMFDASALPYAENIAATRAAAEFAHAHGMWLEGELGQIGGKAGPPLDAHAPGARTDPAEAATFVAATGIDALAVAVGSTHAMTSRRAVLDHDLIARIHAALRVPLVLHGSSGVREDELVLAARSGITKINIGTALNVAFTGAVRAELARCPDLVDPRTYLALAREAMAAVVARYLLLLAA